MLLQQKQFPKLGSIKYHLILSHLILHQIFVDVHPVYYGQIRESRPLQPFNLMYQWSPITELFLVYLRVSKSQILKERLCLKATSKSFLITAVQGPAKY